jgi:Flp pilus assembly pilin Flp
VSYDQFFRNPTSNFGQYIHEKTEPTTINKGTSPMFSLTHSTASLPIHRSSTRQRFRTDSSRAFPKGPPKTKGYWTAVSLCVAGAVALLPSQPVLAGRTPLTLDLSFGIGPIAAQLNITNPVAQPGGGFQSTLHVHARDDTQTPAINADLVATGQAADAETLLGGFVPAAIIVENDLLAGMTFDLAAADAQGKTGVTVNFFNDPTAVEYTVMLALIIVVCITAITMVQPGLKGDWCTIQGNLKAGLKAAGFPTSPPDSCGRAGIAP